MKLASQQIQAVDAIHNWRNRSASQVFRLFGYAGTGKTTLAKYVAEACRLPLFCAFTGKAAHVLRQKGCEAVTIHQAIYSPQERSKQRLQSLETDLFKLENPEDPKDIDLVAIEKIRKEIAAENRKLSSPKFKLNPDGPIKDADLVIIDEVSMVNEQMANDLLSFGVDILVLGDPAQLPPIFGSGYFIDAKADFMLTDIHRQARDNPIIR
ncbi:MAG: AAA family ATPase, partial [Planctomycetota bacterium]